MTKVQKKLRQSAQAAEARSRRLGRDERAKILRVQNLIARAHSKTKVSAAR